MHLRVHLRVKPYYCRWCDYNCMHHSSIRDHLSKCHPEKSHNSCEPGYIFNSAAVPEPESSIYDLMLSAGCSNNSNGNGSESYEPVIEEIDQSNNDCNELATQNNAQMHTRKRKRKVDSSNVNKITKSTNLTSETDNDVIIQDTVPATSVTMGAILPLSPPTTAATPPIMTSSSPLSSSGNNSNQSTNRTVASSNASFYLNNMAAAALFHRMNATMIQQFNHTQNSPSSSPSPSTMPTPPPSSTSSSNRKQNRKLNLIKPKHLISNGVGGSAAINGSLKYPLDLSLNNTNNGDELDEVIEEDEEDVEEEIDEVIEEGEDEDDDEEAHESHDNGQHILVNGIKHEINDMKKTDLGKQQKNVKITRDTQTNCIDYLSDQQQQQGESIDYQQSNNNLFKCTYCNIIFNEYELYSLHIGMHGTNNPWQCNVCSCVCLNKLDFSVHILHLPKNLNLSANN